MIEIPAPGSAAAWRVVKAWRRQGNILAALAALHDELGDVFALPLPGFNSVFLVGPEANKLILAESRSSFNWRAEHDPVTLLLRHGILVEDGAFHDEVRHIMDPALHRSLFEGYLQAMLQCTDQITSRWHAGEPIDLLEELRRITLLILTETLFKDDFSPYIEALWKDILRTIRYISPGLWLVWPGIPRPGYRQARQRLDQYLYELITWRRRHLGASTDVLGRLIDSGLDDGLIRDQLLTMLIAGHDTTTSLLGWTFALLSVHQEAWTRVRAEVDGVLGRQAPTFAQVKQLVYLDQVQKEALRLYPPIHLGLRMVTTDVQFHDYTISAGTRVLYSLYLTHRHKAHWPEPERFVPERFARDAGHQHAPFTYVPFGGGPRNCIGAAFAQMEAKVIVAHILQCFDLHFTGVAVVPRLRATLDPHPAILVEVERR